MSPATIDRRVWASQFRLGPYSTILHVELVPRYQLVAYIVAYLEIQIVVIGLSKLFLI
jgi:hypothetical protein